MQVQATANATRSTTRVLPSSVRTPRQYSKGFTKLPVHDYECLMRLARGPVLVQVLTFIRIHALHFRTGLLQNGECQQSERVMAEYLRLSRKSLRDAIAELIQGGYLAVAKQKHGRAAQVLTVAGMFAPRRCFPSETTTSPQVQRVKPAPVAASTHPPICKSEPQPRKEKESNKEKEREGIGKREKLPVPKDLSSIKNSSLDKGKRERGSVPVSLEVRKRAWAPAEKLMRENVEPYTFSETYEELTGILSFTAESVVVGATPYFLKHNDVKYFERQVEGYLLEANMLRGRNVRIVPDPNWSQEGTR